MQLKTSSFNKGIYFYNLKRFWLISFAYSFFLGLFAIGSLSSMARVAGRIGYTISEKNLASGFLTSSGSFMNVFMAFFSLVSALAVFSYMHYTKSAAMIHSLPVTRKTLFMTNYFSGLTLVMFPVLLIGTMLFIGQAILGISSLQYVLIWMLISAVTTLLLYSFAVFAGMFTGHMAAQAIFYVIFNLLAEFLQSMSYSIFSRLLFGFAYPLNGVLTPFSPFVHIARIYSSFAGDAGEILVLSGYLLAGLAFAWGAGRLYSARRMEAAGDVISLRIMKPVFKYSVAFCSSILVSSLIVALFNLSAGFITYLTGFLIGGFIGYFSAEMLLKKTFKVFRRLRGFLIYAAVIVVILLSVNFDLFGYESYVPDHEEVEIMYVGNYFDEISVIALSPERYDPDRHRFMFGDTDYINNPPAEVTADMLNKLRQSPGIVENPDTLQKALALHEYIADHAAALKDATPQRIDAADPYQPRYVSLSIAYRLRGGRIVRRSYSLPYLEGGGDPLESLIKDLYSSPEMVGKYNPILNVDTDDINFINVSVFGKKNKTISITDEVGKENILEALKADSRELDPLNALAYSRRANPINIEISLNFKEAPALKNIGMIRMDEKTWTITLMTDNENTIERLVDAGIAEREEITNYDAKY